MRRTRLSMWLTALTIALASVMPVGTLAASEGKGNGQAPGKSGQAPGKSGQAPDASPGGSGTRGKSPSHPDGDSDGGARKPGGDGGIDEVASGDRTEKAASANRTAGRNHTGVIVSPAVDDGVLPSGRTSTEAGSSAIDEVGEIARTTRGLALPFTGASLPGFLATGVMLIAGGLFLLPRRPSG